MYMVKVKEVERQDPSALKRVGTAFAMKAIPKRILRHIQPGEVCIRLIHLE